MQADQHPEYDDELKRLSATLAALEAYIHPTADGRLTGGDWWANENLAAQREERFQIMGLSRKSPYFARVDFHEDGRPTQSLYFGYRALNLGENEVIEWRAPMGRLLASGNVERQLVRTPGGWVSGRLLLRRRLSIREAALEEIIDEIDRREGRDHRVEQAGGEGFLLQELYSRGDPRLQDIVKTIQQQQDVIIRAAHQRIILINGVAGSGKTSIALHRLAYLLFPDNQTNIRANRSIVFCPNRVFLRYIEDLLPGLGEKDVLQTTFEEWAIGRMGQAGRLTVIDSTQERLLQKLGLPEEMDRLWERGRLKGSLRMKAMLEKLAEHLRRGPRAPEEGLRYADLGELKLTLTLPVEEVQETLASLQRLSLSPAGMRSRAQAELLERLGRHYEAAVWTRVRQAEKRAERWRDQALDDPDASRRKAAMDQALSARQEAQTIKGRGLSLPQVRIKTMREVEQRLQADLDRLWPQNDAVPAYYGLLADLRLMTQLGKSIFSKEELTLIRRDPPPENCVELEDLPAVYYLFQMINPLPREPYDHIVVDEAQDFSALQMSILREASRDGSMTIVGDVAQGIFGFRGISGWDEFKEVFATDRVQVENITQSYRSTREIVRLANEVLRKTSRGEAVMARPFNRNGRRPRLIILTPRDNLVERVAMEVQRMRVKEGFENIALLTRTKDEAAGWMGGLTRCGIPLSLTVKDLDMGFKYQGGIAVLPVALAKGLEFEAVILPDVSERSYSSQRAYDGKLLYVGITRALHGLSLFSLGSPSGYLDQCETMVEKIEG